MKLPVLPGSFSLSLGILVTAGLLVTALMAGLTGWALLERSAKFECQATSARLSGALSTLGDRVEETNAAVDALATAQAAAKAASQKALAAATQRAQALDGRAQVVSERIAAASASGGRSCADAVAEIRRGEL